jgi:hypothetical protein
MCILNFEHERESIISIPPSETVLSVLSPEKFQVSIEYIILSSPMNDDDSIEKVHKKIESE